MSKPAYLGTDTPMADSGLGRELLTCAECGREWPTQPNAQGHRMCPCGSSTMKVEIIPAKMFSLGPSAVGAVLPKPKPDKRDIKAVADFVAEVSMFVSGLSARWSLIEPAIRRLAAVEAECNAAEPQEAAIAGRQPVEVRQYTYLARVATEIFSDVGGVQFSHGLNDRPYAAVLELKAFAQVGQQVLS